MINFADRLTGQIRATNNPTVMGLDPLFEYIPEYLYADKKLKADRNHPGSATLFDITAETILVFNKLLIDAVKDVIPAVKPQIAYYENLGVPGIQVYMDTIDYAKKAGMLVIADAKRNDIGSTASMYSQAYLGSTALFDGNRYPVFDADALTVNAYLGIDGIAPFISDCEKEGKGIFILVRTSNPSAGDFQDLKTESGEYLYEAVARKVDEWGRSTIGRSGYSSIGAVVGATWPDQAKVLRQRMPAAMILVPGYGAQGGSGGTAANCFDDKGGGAIVNASRSLMCAYMKGDFSPEDFQEATYREALRMKEDLNRSIADRLD
ncbi:MAG: orotidine-5'-phosphate decarboxylase [Saccharofermentanales bacterium]